MSLNLRVFLAIVCITLAGVVIWGVWYVFAGPKSPTPQPATPPSVATQEITPTDLQKVRHQYAPWTRTAPNDTGAPHLVMLLQSGAVDESSKTVQFGPGWKQAQPFQIVNFKEIGNRVRLRTNSGHLYTIGYDQAFILEQSPSDVFVLRRNGSSRPVLMTIPTNRLSR